MLVLRERGTETFVFLLSVIKYRVTICTGNVSGSGTDASVFLNVFGDLGDTGERLMFMSKNNVNKFEKGNVSEYSYSFLFHERKNIELLLEKCTANIFSCLPSA